MPAATHNFFIEQGSNFVIIFEYFDAAGNLQDLTNYCIRLRLKSSDDTFKQIYTSNMTSSGFSLTKPASRPGTIEWFLSYSETQKFNFDTALYDLDISIPNSATIRLATGIIQLIKTNFPECSNDTTGICSSCESAEQVVNTPTTTPTVTVTITNTTTPTVTATESIIAEDLCDYLCQNLDIFAKVYNYNSSIKHINNVTSGTILVNSNDTLFTLPYPYVSGLLDLYKNNILLSPNIDYTIINNNSFQLSTSASGQRLQYYNKGIFISDNSSVTGTLTVPDSGIATNVEVNIHKLKHENPQDLVMILTPPTGNKVLLSAYNKINNYNATSGISYTFSNRAMPGVYLNNKSAVDPYVNILDKRSVYKTNDTLSVSLNNFVGTCPSGNWSLSVYDNDIGSSGTINSWDLIVTYEPPSYSNFRGLWCADEAYYQNDIVTYSGIYYIGIASNLETYAGCQACTPSTRTDLWGIY
jgi:subtilisin-like proprotein convertase family protein